MPIDMNSKSEEQEEEIWRVQRCEWRHTHREVAWHNIGYLFPFPTLERAIAYFDGWKTQEDDGYRYRIWNQMTGETIPWEALGE